MVLGEVCPGEQGKGLTVELVESDARLAFAMFLPAEAGVEGAGGGQVADAKRDKGDALGRHISLTLERPPSSATVMFCARLPRLSNRPGSVPVISACAPSAQISS